MWSAESDTNMICSMINITEEEWQVVWDLAAPAKRLRVRLGKSRACTFTSIEVAIDYNFTFDCGRLPKGGLVLHFQDKKEAQEAYEAREAPNVDA